MGQLFVDSPGGVDFSSSKASVRKVVLFPVKIFHRLVTDPLLGEISVSSSFLQLLEIFLQESGDVISFNQHISREFFEGRGVLLFR